MTSPVLYATQFYDGDGSTELWTFAFAGNRPDAESGTTPYLRPEDVKAVLVIPRNGDTPGSEVPLTLELVGPNVAKIVPPVPVGTKNLKIYRDSNLQYSLVNFWDLLQVQEYDLDLTARQLLMVTQEAYDRAALAEEAAQEAIAGTGFATSDALAAEVGNRLTGDSANAAAITAEATVRAAGDTANATNIAANAAAITAEQSARASGDSALSAALSSEVASRTAADADLQAQIDALPSPVGWRLLQQSTYTTAGAATFTAVTGAALYEIVAVGGGGCSGEVYTASAGPAVAGGGGAGGSFHCLIPASSMPATLSLVVGAGAVFGGGSAGNTTLDFIPYGTAAAYGGANGASMGTGTSVTVAPGGIGGQIVAPTWVPGYMPVALCKGQEGSAGLRLSSISTTGHNLHRGPASLLGEFGSGGAQPASTAPMASNPGNAGCVIIRAYGN